MVSPATRLCRPRAMVSTSGSSGMGIQFTAWGKSRRTGQVNLRAAVVDL